MPNDHSNSGETLVLGTACQTKAWAALPHGIRPEDVPVSLWAIDQHTGKRALDKISASVRATKTNFLTNDSISFGGYNIGTLSYFCEEPFGGDIAQLYKVLFQASQSEHRRTYLILGAMTDRLKSERTQARRRSDPKKYPRDQLTIIESASSIVIRDLDDADVPGWDPFNPEQGIEWIVQQLGPAYQSADVIVQISGSQKPTVGAKARVRLYFVLNKPWSQQQHKVQMQDESAAHPDLHIDPSIWHAGRVIYIADPLFVTEASPESFAKPKNFTAPDPISKRWFLYLKNGQLRLPAPENASTFRYRESKSGKNGGPRVSGIRIPFREKGYELEALLEHDTRIHDKILDATLNLARNCGDVLAIDDAVRQVREGLESLVRSGLLASRADRIHSPELAAEIERAYIGELYVFHGRLEANTPDPSLDATAGSAALTRAIQRFFDDAPRKMLITAPMGIGKTTTLIKEALVRRLRVDLYVPDHRLATDLSERIHVLGGKSIVIKGRTTVLDTTPPITEDSARYCRKWKTIDAVSAVPGAIPLSTGDLCQRRDRDHMIVAQCPHFQACEYVKQFTGAAINTQFVIRPHAYLSVDCSNLDRILEKQIGKADANIIDENPITSLIQSVSVKFSDLRQQANPDDFIIGDTQQVILDALRSGSDVVQALWQWVTDELASENVTYFDAIAERMTSRIESLWEQVRHHHGNGIHPGMTDAESIDEISMCGVKPAPWLFVARLLLLSVANHWQRLNGLRSDRQNGELMVIIEWLHNAGRVRSSRTRLLMIDGSPDTNALRQIFPVVEEHLIRVKRNAKVLQVRDRTISDKWLSENPTGLADIISFARLMNLVTPTGAVVRKSIEGEFKKHEIETLHYGALRGQNNLEHCQALVCVGRMQPRAEPMEAEAMAIYQDADINADGGYVRDAARYRVGPSSIRVFEGVLWTHPDARVQRRLEHYRENELAQAVDRARLIHNKEPKLIVLFTSQPVSLDLTVELVSFHDLLGPEGLMTLMAAHTGRLPLNWRWLRGNHPEKFLTDSAAKDFANRAIKWVEQGKLELAQLRPDRRDGARGKTGWAIEWIGWSPGDEMRSEGAPEHPEMVGLLKDIYKNSNHYSFQSDHFSVSGNASELVQFALTIACELHNEVTRSTR